MAENTNRIHVNYMDKPSYDILYDRDMEFIKEELSKFHLHNRKIAIVTDRNVGNYHLKNLEMTLGNVSDSIFVYSFPAGEEQKNLKTVQELYSFLIQHSFDRNDCLLALGGGVVGDLTGFTAATYLRGIRFFQVPTSLLAMVDSSIGGKTGVDFDAYKNMVGAFYMPSGVYMNLSTLFSLPEKEYLSGMGEVIKHGLIRDRFYYESLKQNVNKIRERDLDLVMPMVMQSCEIKRAVVEKDPKELGDRALLNFGHTIGHAVEKVMNFSLLHGECVAIGMIAAAYISMERKFITLEDLEDIKVTISEFGLPTTIPKLPSSDILSAVTKDKKMDGNQIKFILLKGIGNAIIDTTVTKEEMTRAIAYIQAQ